ncbi:hypothetical protein ABB37_05466 [Leptomonas pyrrhocoris]|uniref:Uncharacterized protein n=1 Tax=Leptomonas pyrrhocoris TaxID=157538 RepID=A0A0M9G076_LEPPY|nr:hypothetical protein ABB37_05466 [Leptomonas pyrrhocoris]XP_015658134.1 hypothetical protein ABB37_05466 [Leptomonas pyrrhocoris]KPA79694.1 hypothetical protein ABB37_05466 [Leptomonas pyrrhocoris]KPA79695.1 hypothetical protein ABB37_05466 [Leptomonas pyrrhocoris]|eukprot:XP_015658133.1 hypothetical protein ABB37_05466 [Leptomonas pyrrhocoris]
MFTTDKAPSAAAVARLAAFRARHAGADVPTSRDLSPQPTQGSDYIAELLARYTTPDEARKAYRNPPASMLIDSEDTSGLAAPENSLTAGTASSSGAIAQALKKARRENATAALAASSSSSASLNDSANAAVRVGLAADGSPTAVFVEGVERVNYLGKSFLEPPSSLLEHEEETKQKPCQPPRTLRGVFKVPEAYQAAPQRKTGEDSSASPASSGKDGDAHASKEKIEGGAHRTGKTPGVQQLRWAPATHGHLLFSGDLAGQCRLWSSTSRQLLATFSAHTQPIKSLEVTKSAALMSTGSVDGTVAVWDVEAGRCVQVLTNPERLPVVQHLHHPSDEAHLLLAAVDKKVVLYDVRASCSKYQREYTGHMGTIFNLTLLSDGSKMLTTSEDKTLRTWDYRSPVQIKQFADAAMHAITHVLHHPTQPEYLAAQSLDNKVIVFRDDGGGRLRLLHDREFTGHTISGTRCQLGFSHDGRYLSSGDISGKLYVWNWATKKLEKSFKAHAQMLVSHLWHPIEPSKVVTAAWDGHINNWV